MKNFNEYFKMNENLYDELSDNMSSEHKSLKKGILELIEKTVEDSTKLLNVQNFIDEYLEEDNESTIKDFDENDSDVYEFYLKYQVDIDSILSDNDFYDESPSELNIYSLYDYMIEGTKKSVKLCLKDIYEEVFKVD